MKSIEATAPIPEAFMFLSYVYVSEINLKSTITTLKKDDYFSYSVEIKTNTPQLGEFTTHVRYCINWVTEDSCKLDVSVGVQFLKNNIFKGASF